MVRFFLNTFNEAYSIEAALFKTQSSINSSVLRKLSRFFNFVNNGRLFFVKNLVFNLHNTSRMVFPQFILSSTRQTFDFFQGSFFFEKEKSSSRANFFFHQVFLGVALRRASKDRLPRHPRGCADSSIRRRFIPRYNSSSFPIREYPGS